MIRNAIHKITPEVLYQAFQSLGVVEKALIHHPGVQQNDSHLPQQTQDGRSLKGPFLRVTVVFSTDSAAQGLISTLQARPIFPQACYLFPEIATLDSVQKILDGEEGQCRGQYCEELWTG